VRNYSLNHCWQWEKLEKSLEKALETAGLADFERDKDLSNFSNLGK
jgi:hypothetical protein